MAVVWFALGLLVFGLNLLWFLIWPSPRLDLYFDRFWSKPRSSPAAPGANHKDIRYHVTPYLRAVGSQFVFCFVKFDRLTSRVPPRRSPAQRCEGLPDGKATPRG